VEKFCAPLSVSDLRVGDHVFWLSEDENSSVDFDLSYRAILENALHINAAVLSLYHFRNPSARIAEWQSAFEIAIQSQQFQFEAASEVFLSDGMFSSERAVQALHSRAAALRDCGFESIFVVVDMTWIFEAALGAARIAELESMIDKALQNKHTILCCRYEKQFFKPAFLLELLSAYRRVLIQGEVYENLYFISSDSLQLEQHHAAIFNQSIETLRSLGKAEVALNERSRELRQSEAALEMLQSIIESMGDGVFVVDETGDMLFCNKASERILGYGFLNLPIEDRVRKIGNFLPDAHTPYPVEELPIARAIRGESTDEVEIFIKNDQRPEGVWITSSGRPLRDRSGAIKGGLVVTRDITPQKRAVEERARMEEQMFRSQKLESLGVLAGGIAHDFNNLLMGVLGNANLAEKEIPADSPLHARIGQISIAARRLADLTNQLLAYSGKGPFAKENLDISDLVREMGELLRPAVSRRAAIEYHFANDLPAIVADGTQIRQIVLNLITNASDAIGEGNGSIDIRTGLLNASGEDLQNTYLADDLKPGLYVYLEVSDTGSGMDEETIAKIFDPFFTTKFTGRGLGLAAVLGIVRRHHGALQVRSVKGHGSRFRVLLPAANSPTPSQEHSLETAENWHGSGKVLLVDDEPTVRETAGEMLRHLGFEPLMAGTGKQALSLFHEHTAELRAVILDLTMPDMDGETVLSRMRQVSQQTRFVLSSGYHESDIVSRLGKKIIRGYLQKPYCKEQLQRVLQKALIEAPVQS